MKEFKDGVSTNGMVIHNQKYHQGSKEFHFKMEALRTFQKPLDRQIEEALRIKNSEFEILMNSGTEWRIDSVPRARFTAPGLGRRQERMSSGPCWLLYLVTEELICTVNLEWKIFLSKQRKEKSLKL